MGCIKYSPNIPNIDCDQSYGFSFTSQQKNLQEEAENVYFCQRKC